MTPEQQARVEIDRLLQAAGWHVCSVSNVNLQAARGVAVREFSLNTGHGFADYFAQEIVEDPGTAVERLGLIVADLGQRSKDS